MRDFYTSSEPVPLDQADGLRRMFAGQRRCVMALASNPFVAFPGVVIERLAAAAASLGRHTLVVDAADSASAPHEMARIDLSVCVERLTPELSYLPARGLPVDYIDTRGTAAAFLDAAVDAAPRADLILVHAGASDLARLFARRPTRPVVMTSDHPEGLKHAYSSVKLLAQRASLMTFDLLISAAESSPRVQHIADSLAGCADSFLGSLMRGWAVVDPASEPMDELPTDLCRVMAAQLALDASAELPPPRAAAHAPAPAFA